MNKKNKEKIILITGCSSGFGLLTAVHLASQGNTVIATMRSLSKQNDLLSFAKEKNCTVDVFPLDVTKPETILTVVSQVINKYGRIDVLINNAGYSVGGFFEDLSDEDVRQLMDTNFFGVQNVTRAVLPFMREQKSGKIINISSISGLTAYPCLSAYNSSKWALEAFSEALRYEVEPFGIKVCMVEPGAYRTKIFIENAHFAKHFDDPKSPYYAWSQALKIFTMEKIHQNKKDPMDIALVIERLIQQKNPPLRTIPGAANKLLWFLRKNLPFKIFAGIVSTIFWKKVTKRK